MRFEVDLSSGRRGISMVLVTLAAQSSWSSYFLVPVIMSMARLRDAEDRKGRQTNFVDYACAGAALSLGIASVFMLDTSRLVCHSICQTDPCPASGSKT